MERKTIFDTITEFTKHAVSTNIVFLIDSSILLFLLYILDLNYLIAVGIGYCIGIIFNYILSTRWVYKNRKYEDQKKKEIIIFVLLAILGLFINEAGIWIFVELILLNIIIAKIAASIILSITMFTLRKKFLF
ncbi:MAG: GtrA family protein [Candidatus Woesearchaeota archaeon]